MKVSINLMKQFGGQGLDGSTDILIKNIGSQLGEVEGSTKWGSKYSGILVVKVIQSEKHPNADKLTLCLIDDNKVAKGVQRTDKGLIQVVCGAPNVRSGMLAAWIPPGIAVPSTVDKDRFVLETREIRGETSNGMLASLHELGISDDHDGILEILPADIGKELAKPGTNFKKLYGLDDTIIDIENKMFTHRPDCFGQLGVAREIAGIYHKAFKSPAWYVKNAGFKSYTSTVITGLTVENKIPKLCPRYMAIAIENVQIKPSPVWMQSELCRLGVKPINNIVDITNWVMHLTGQPLHAFDFDKVAVNGKVHLVIRNPKKDEKITLLDGKTITPRNDAVLICNQNNPLALGGIMGGNNSEIEAATTNIIIECANFNMYNIRRTSMHSGVFSDAVTRFNKGQSPEQVQNVLNYAVSLVVQQCEDSKPIGQALDDYKKHYKNPLIAVSANFVNNRLGTKLSLREMAKMLENVEFDIKSVPADKTRLHIQAPFWRTDIEQPEDIVEEVGRLNGYDNVIARLPNRPISPAQRNSFVDFKNRLRAILAASGANEVLNYTFVHKNLLVKAGQDPTSAFQLANALSPELQYYRVSLLPSLLDKVHSNLKSDRIRNEDNEYSAFEINPVHAVDFFGKDNLPDEDHKLALIFVADDKTAQRKYEGSAYYAAVAFLQNVLESLGIKTIYHSAAVHQPKAKISQAALAPFDKKRTALVKTEAGDFLGVIGEFSAETKRNLKLPSFAAGFEIDTLQLMKSASISSQYQILSRFPKVTQDLTMRVPSSVSYSQFYEMLTINISELMPQNVTLTLDSPTIYQSADDSSHKNITLRLWMSHYDRTLKNNEVNTLLDSAVAVVEKALGAQRV